MIILISIINFHMNISIVLHTIIRFTSNRSVSLASLYDT